MSLIFELREICLSFQVIFSLASAVVVRQILDSTSGLDPDFTVATAPRYLKLPTLSSFSPLTLMSTLMTFLYIFISTFLYFCILKI